MRRWSHRLWLLALVPLALLLAVSCGPRGKGLQLKEENSGQKVTLDVGQTLTLTLKSNPTTGYQWQIAQLEEAVLKLSSYEYRADMPITIGSGGVDVWSFEAQAPGQTTLRLEYVRPWEEGKEPIQTFSVEVVVR